MTLVLLIQVILNGLIKGLIYALTAAGFSLIYGQARILFFAMGEVYMLGAVVCYVSIVLLGLPYVVAVLVSLAVLGIFGVFLERMLFRSLEARGANALITAFASMLIGMLLMGLTMESFGERGKGIPSPFGGVMNVAGVYITFDKLAVVIIAVLLLVGFHLFFKHHRLGRAIRAVTQDMDAAQLVGIKINRMRAVTFFLALGLGGIAGAVVSPLSYVDPFIGTPVLMTTLIVVVLGGLGSFMGAIVGGLAIGLVESFGLTFLGGSSTIISFLVVIGVLIFRPQGLLGNE